MAYFYRLIGYLGAALLLTFSFSGTAQAYTSSVSCASPPCYEYRAAVDGAGWYPKAEGAAPDITSQINADPSFATYFLSGCDIGVCTWGGKYAQAWGGGDTAPYKYTFQRRNALAGCANGGTLSGSSCVCPAGATDTGSACALGNPEADNCASLASLQNVITMGVDGGPNFIRIVAAAGAAPLGSGTVCRTGGAGMPAGRGCLAEFVRDISTTDASGAYVSSGQALYRDGKAAAPCTPSGAAGAASTDKPQAVPQLCKGQSGSVNGVDVCLPYSSITKPVVTDKVVTNTTVGSDGQPVDTIKTDSTTCSAGICKTDSVVTVSGGGSSSSSTSTPGSTPGTSSVTQPKGDFCKGNPSSLQCGGGNSGSGFGGSCKSGFTCDGDAVSCAAAAAVNKASCSLLQIESVEGYGAPALAAAGVDKPSDSPVNNKRSIDVSSFIVKSNPFSGACPADYPINIPHVGPIAVPLSAYCGVFTFLGNVLLGLSLLSGAVIIAKRD